MVQGANSKSVDRFPATKGQFDAALVTTFELVGNQAWRPVPLLAQSGRTRRVVGQEVLAGLVERVTFHNTEKWFLRPPGEDTRTPRSGDRRRPRGDDLRRRKDHRVRRMDQRRTHGQQFKARFLKASAPSSIDGIEKYLGSGMIRGIGPVYAKKLVRAFEGCRKAPRSG
jgi:hypothetical protein